MFKRAVNAKLDKFKFFCSLCIQAGNIERKSTKQWAQENGYSTQKLFQKFFNDDIKYLLSMDKLWAKRRPPTPLDW